MRFLLHRESPLIPIVLLTILVGCWSELDLYAPSFPQMMHYFATTEQAMQWTLSLNFLGFFFASLLCGPLADSFGRRPVILAGSLLFLIGSLLCLVATSIEAMFVGRFVQGLGVSAPVTVCMAVIADIYQGERQVKLLSRMNSCVTVTMALAPIVGVYLTQHFGWRSNFGVIFAVALLGCLLIWLFVPETHDKENRVLFSAKSLVSGYIKLLRSREFMIAVLGLCLMVTPYFIFIGIIPLLFMEELGVSLNEYVYYQGSVVGLFSVLSLMTPVILKLNVNKVMRASLAMSFGALGLSFVLSLVMKDNPLVITFLMWVFTAGLVVPPMMMFASAMDMYPELRACASSLIQSVRMFFMALGTGIAGFFYSDSYMPAVLVMFLFVAASAPFVYYVIRKRESTQGTTDEIMLPAMH